MRFGYEFRGSTFDYFADTLSADPSLRGGYFSPHRFVMHLGVVQLSQRLGDRLTLEFDARAGTQEVRIAAESLPDSRAASAFNAHAAWRLTRSTDLDLRYLYVDAFDAFRMKDLRVALRQHF
jgi:hypothetical protein